ncbi:MAG TPA: hypothetical protein VGR91_08145, partial [Stellaceae bacterium]|nr:hypothetical protein [Stellaceae bacterium]
TVRPAGEFDMQRITLLSLIAAGLVSAALPASAGGPAKGGLSCDERSFTPDNSTLRPGRTIGPARVQAYFQGARQDCPESLAACSDTASIMPGEALLLGAARAGYVCAIFADGPEARAGWIAQRRIAAAPRPVDPGPPLAAWLGRWRQYDNRIALTRAGGRIAADGQAYWPGKSIMPANEGAFSGSASPSGRRLHIAAGLCEVDMTLAGYFLFAEDNRMCGGHNASFTGIFIRRPDAPR